MIKVVKALIFLSGIVLIISCNTATKKETKITNLETQTNITAKEILGNPKYLAISYGGYRAKSRVIQPTIVQIKNDMKILNAMGVKLLRTYNLQLEQAPNVLKAIRELKREDANFEMYVMLGAWIDCENAWTEHPNHNEEDIENNTSEINKAVDLANKYPDIVKIIAVGNEAMVHWASSYFVQPSVILKWVNHLQKLKTESKLPKQVWITSSDNFASWGGGDAAYHNQDLEALVKAVDYISMHTYPMHDTHYNPVFWGIKDNETQWSNEEKNEAAMLRAKDYAISQYASVKKYVASLNIKKPIHIGETGWASYTNDLYGNEGSKATDEFKQGLYYKHMREWTNQAGLSCFYFEAFDEHWKDPQNQHGSENNFGLFTLNGQAKYALWYLVDKGVFNGLTRNGNKITKTYNGSKNDLLNEVRIPQLLKPEEIHH
ncbi:glycosyl hydrolase family 17 [Lacinutrix salivirga]